MGISGRLRNGKHNNAPPCELCNGPFLGTFQDGMNAAVLWYNHIPPNIYCPVSARPVPSLSLQVRLLRTPSQVRPVTTNLAPFVGTLHNVCNRSSGGTETRHARCQGCDGGLLSQPPPWLRWRRCPETGLGFLSGHTEPIKIWYGYVAQGWQKPELEVVRGPGAVGRRSPHPSALTCLVFTTRCPGPLPPPPSLPLRPQPLESTDRPCCGVRGLCPCPRKPTMNDTRNGKAPQGPS